MIYPLQVHINRPVQVRSGQGHNGVTPDISPATHLRVPQASDALCQGTRTPNRGALDEFPGDSDVRDLQSAINTLPP